MTRDVFKYFKQVRSLQESTTSERAHELGYEYQARGVWMDPKDGKRYKAQGNRFIPMPEKEVDQREPGQQKDPKSLDQFRQDATGGQQPPQEEPTALPQVPDGLSDEEFADAIAKQNTGGSYLRLALFRDIDGGGFSHFTGGTTGHGLITYRITGATTAWDHTNFVCYDRPQTIKPITYKLYLSNSDNSQNVRVGENGATEFVSAMEIRQ